MKWEIDIGDEFESHMDNQPWSCQCSECGEDIDYTKTIDSDGDMTIIINPCKCGDSDE